MISTGNDLYEAMSQLKLNPSGTISLGNEELSHSLDMIAKVLHGGGQNEAVQHLINSGIITTLRSLLHTEDGVFESIGAKVAEIISVLSKYDEVGNFCADMSVIGPLMDLLDSEDNHTVLEAHNALQNLYLCNGKARSLVKERKGVEKNIHLLQRLVKMDNIPERLKRVASDCLFQLRVAYEEIQDHEIQTEIVDVLLQCLEKFYCEADIGSNCLVVLDLLANNYDIDVGRNKLMEPAILAILSEMLRKDIPGKVMEQLLEFLDSLSRNDVVKLCLAELGVCETLIDIIKKCDRKSTKDRPEEFRIACNIILLVLQDDSSMEYLYMEQNGPVYKETLSWITSSDETLQMCGALAVANFARKGDFCIHMMEDSVVKDLLILLENHNGQHGDINVLHAVLSALRNVAIPSENKQTLETLDVLDKILPVVEVQELQTPRVVFKLLGTLRMLIDGQEAVATSLGINCDVVRQIVDWCSNHDYPLVRKEASRLLAWIITNSKCKSVKEVLLDEGFLPHLIAMVNSEHDVIQNDALTALNLLTSTFLGESQSLLRQTGIIYALYNRVAQYNASTEVLLNALSVTSNISASGLLNIELMSVGICKHLKYLSSNHSDSAVQEKAQSCVESIEKNSYLCLFK